MRPLTKKYIFECKLKGEPIDLTSYQGPEAWKVLVPELEKLGLLTENNGPIRECETAFLTEEGAKKYHLQYSVKIKYQRDIELITEILRPGPLLIRL